MNRRNLLAGIAAVVVVGGWYAFRPERLFINQTVSETFETAAESSAPMAVLSGSFRSVSHETQGVATIYQAADGMRTLRLTQFHTSNGPDVRIYLVAANDASDNETVKNAGFIDLGAMKGNVGDQNYEVPADVDLTRYRAITVWCRRFGVNFATAPLTMGGAGDMAAEFTVRIENVSTPTTLKLSNGETAPAPTSPVAWALVRSGNPIFTPGAIAGTNGLEQLAEEGNPTKLAESLAAMSGVVASGAVAIPLGDTEAGPALPGKTFEITFTAKPGDKLLLAMMFGQSNDWFYANADAFDLFDANGRPLTNVDHTAHLTLWDAGTEVNEEPGLGPNQGPRQTSPDAGKVENGVIRSAGDDFPAPPVTQVIKATVMARQAIASGN